MFITYDLLKNHGACEDGLKWFKDNYPNGCELSEVKDAPAEFVWWFYNNIQQDERLYRLCGVNHSFGVNGSNGVNYSNGVNGSDGVNGSNGVNYSDGVNCSNGVNGSNGVNYSNGVNGSDGVNGSNGVNYSFGVNGSLGISNSFGVNGSFGISNSFGVDMALFLSNKPRTYSIFGREVSEERFYEVREKLYDKLSGWRPTFNNIKALYLANGSDWKLTPIKDAENISKKEAWADMPKPAIKYVKSLPEFDAEMFKEITELEGDKTNEQ